ncbi:MAG: IS66 family transposase [Bacillota bacterium]|nr:IS66 family transposase [Bacillota bacterium]
MSKEVRKELKIIPAQVKVVEHVRYVYTCRQCEKENTKTPVITAKMPKPVMPGSFVSPSLLAFIMDKKYAQAMPLYRQEKQFINFRIDISRQNMANWVLHGSNTWLKLLYDRMHVFLLKKSVLNADETPMQVLDEPGRSAKSKSYMWLYATGINSDKQIFLYDYQPSRANKHPKNFLTGFSGFLQTDGYIGYNAVENVTLIGCFAHARRYFNDALKALPKESIVSKTTAGIGLEYCNKSFKIEKDLKDLKSHKRYEIRLERSKPVLDDYFGLFLILCG